MSLAGPIWLHVCACPGHLGFWCWIFPEIVSAKNMWVDGGPPAEYQKILFDSHWSSGSKPLFSLCAVQPNLLDMLSCGDGIRWERWWISFHNTISLHLRRKLLGPSLNVKAHTKKKVICYQNNKHCYYWKSDNHEKGQHRYCLLYFVAL